MKRLTEHRDNGVILVNIIEQKESAIHRLAAIEDILGDDYDLDRLRELVEAEQAGRCFITGRPYPVAEKAADVAPVVRCRECIMHGNCTTEDVFNCSGMDMDEAFCCAGKRKNGDVNGKLSMPPQLREAEGAKLWEV